MNQPLAISFLVGSSLLLGCGDDSPGRGGGGGGGGGGGAQTSASSTTTATTSTTSTGGDGGGGAAGDGGGGSGGDGGGGAPACSGDAEAWDAIQKTDIPCDAHADCCVVVNSCIAQAVVVGASDFEKAQEVWPSCEGDCVDCFVPYLVVLCEEGFCAAYADEIEFAPPASSSCGAEVPSPGNNGPGEAFDCSGAPM